MSRGKGWASTNLGELVSIVGGGTPNRKVESYWQGKIPWATVKDLHGTHPDSPQESISELGFTNSASNIIPAGTVIMPTRMALGKAAIFAVDVAINQDLKALFIKNDHTLDRDFLLRFILANSEQIESEGKGATVKGITIDFLQQMKVPLPPLSEQRRIAAILDSADAIRTKRKAAIAKLDELAQAVFLEMFGDPVRNEKGWEVISLRDEITFMTSGSRGWAKYHSNEGALFIKIQNVKNSRLVFDSVQHVVPPATQETNRTKVQEGDLLISITADLGRTAIVDRETARRGAYINQHLVLVRLKKRSLLPMFASHYLESPAGKRQFSSLDQSAVKSGLNFDSINRLALIAPPLDLQASFIDRISSIVQLKNREALALNKEESLFSSLQHRAFTGEL